MACSIHKGWIALQRQFFCGHKRMHGLKWQFISTPDGILYVTGPHNGPQRDGPMAHDSKTVQWAVTYARRENGSQVFLYGDQANGTNPAILSTYRGDTISREQERFNMKMNT
ncbi:uncharacterized protein MEPE_02700 [Melanopsichium pennsylvanicum]|uniref:Uncharacterized protein n=2 Tax=Melanopsichium pennsylvanicum TaxID=63383 RepID=A0AAJ4XKJ7_9BASI|nr:uncharacterized protein BN887_06192 [Melanopsichium pennsylvanicum 4]SNX83992.1 uncharacterized protein MEPE_02700 [Melanopsichium pennsylvanicum]